MTKIVGNDISNFQGDINFDVYKDNANFIIIKATEGTGYRDPKLSRNQSEARRVKLPLGYYHFARPDLHNDPIAEANYFLTNIGALHDGEILCLDFEVEYSDAVNWCKQWLDHVYQATKVKPLIYMDQSRLTKFNWKTVSDAGYGLWLAVYTGDPNNNNFPTGAWQFAAMQQWTSSQHVPGINGNLDGDVFFGDQATFKKYGYITPPPQPPAVNWEQKYNDEVQKNKTLTTQNEQLTTQNRELQTKIDNAKKDLA